jgi:hypothetical protein
MKNPAPVTTPDGRYIVIIGKVGPRLWRAANPSLGDAERSQFTSELMSARRAVRDATNDAEITRARGRVHAAKIALGERGLPWWIDGSPDLNRRLVKNTCYADWWTSLGSSPTKRV